MMPRNHAGRRLGLAVAVIAELEIPNAIGLLNVRRLQLRHFFEPTAGECRDQARPGQCGAGLVLGWRKLELGISEQLCKFLISEWLVMNGRRFDPLAVERVCRRLLAPDRALEDGREQHRVTVACSGRDPALRKEIIVEEVNGHMVGNFAQRQVADLVDEDFYLTPVVGDGLGGRAVKLGCEVALEGFGECFREPLWQRRICDRLGLDRNRWLDLGQWWQTLVLGREESAVWQRQTNAAITPRNLGSEKCDAHLAIGLSLRFQ